jgi:hypothetical protein
MSSGVLGNVKSELVSSLLPASGWMRFTVMLCAGVL